MTYRESVEAGKQRLEKAGIEDASLDAWLLLEHIAHMNRASYYMHAEEKMLPVQESEYRKLIEKRADHIPLQHLTGTQEFMGLEFAVNEHVLIPRQDTEILVEEARKYLRPQARVLDMCTGSGCILISLCNYADTHKIVGVKGFGADVSEKALEVANINAKKLLTDVSFLQSDLFENVDGVFDLIVSNPPYIETSVIESLEKEVRLHDPHIALDGKEDGLYFYRKIIETAREYLAKDASLILEIGYDQGESVPQIMEEHGYAEVVVKKDLAGYDRVVSGIYNLQ